MEYFISRHHHITHLLTEQQKTWLGLLKKRGRESDINTEIAKFILSYNNTKHYATGVSPAELYIERKLFTSFDRLTPGAKFITNLSHMAAKKCYRGGRSIDFSDKDMVMCRNYGQGDKWVKGVIVKKLSPVMYLIQMSNGILWKRYVNQLMDRDIDKPSTNMELVELLDNNNKHKVESEVGSKPVPS